MLHCSATKQGFINVSKQTENHQMNDLMCEVFLNYPLAATSDHKASIHPKCGKIRPPVLMQTYVTHIKVSQERICCSLYILKAFLKKYWGDTTVLVGPLM